jgi:hypothetical protein
MVAVAPPTPTNTGGWARAARLGSADRIFFSVTGNIHQSGNGEVTDLSCQARPLTTRNLRQPAFLSTISPIVSVALAECQRGPLPALGSSEHGHRPAPLGVLLKTSGIRQ